MDLTAHRLTFDFFSCHTSCTILRLQNSLGNSIVSITHCCNLQRVPLYCAVLKQIHRQDESELFLLSALSEWGK